MLLKKLVIVGLAASLLAGCASDGSNQNATLGTLAGAVGGAALGSAFGSGSGKVAAIAGGALIGGFLGNQIGASLDRESQQYNYNASVQALDNRCSAAVAEPAERRLWYRRAWPGHI